jgi:gamma-glutamyl hydrolase
MLYHLSHLNGVLFTGGMERFYDLDENGNRVPDRYMQSAILIMNFAMKENDEGRHFPIWGTCLGLQMFHYFADINTEMQVVHAANLPTKLNFTEAAKTSKLYSLVEDWD